MLNKLKYNPDNPRTITKPKYKQIKDSIKEFPKMLEARPIVYDERLIVLGGNQRLKALRQLVKEGKIESKPEYFKSVNDFTDKEKRRFVIIDNLVGGSWENDLLIEKWDKQELEEWGLDVKDWHKPAGSEALKEDDDSDEPKEEKITCPECKFSWTKQE